MTRKVAILAAGTRGDIQPCVALARELTAHGDSVRLIAPIVYERLSTGFEFTGLTVDPAQIFGSFRNDDWPDEERIRFGIGLKKIVRPKAERLFAEILEACRDVDLILYPAFGFLGHHIAQHLGIAEALMHFQPFHPTSAFPHPFVPRAFGANRLSFHAVDQMGWQTLRPYVEPWRRELGLPRLPARGPMREIRGVPVLCAFSETLVPRPADWQAYVHLTGFWFADEADFTPDPALRDFLAAGPPPVYVGFGSMLPRDPAETDAIVRSALRKAGVRGVIRRHDTLEDMVEGPQDDDSLFVVGDVPHSWLFPRMAAVVHHGGAGTTAAGLRAGRPTVICPFFIDQPFWAERVLALGAGTRPLPIKKLEASALAERITAAVGDPAIRERAAEVGLRISAENGVGRARAALEALSPRLAPLV
jgi:sterol 3beta-glucosyltransferase